MAMKALAKNKGGRPVGSKKPIPENVAKSIGDMDTPAQVKALIKRLAQHCIRNEISTLQTSALNGLLLSWIKLYEMDDVARRLTALEEKIDKSIRKGGRF